MQNSSHSPLLGKNEYLIYSSLNEEQEYIKNPFSKSRECEFCICPSCVYTIRFVKKIDMKRRYEKCVVMYLHIE